ncbi:DNA polymerase alpha catalytic subunit [Fragariocoptes setiger]|uniref:DNA polymerase n=1 Tax=Fragariocoptes setiger TaxID=1670756 RepID=A0ABQ7S8S2_9ACAR|nr:DNA polymerase alpha catalytic subunit [Fragariocoptes setiger]
MANPGEQEYRIYTDFLQNMTRRNIEGPRSDNETVTLDYVWIDGTRERLRSKHRAVSKDPKSITDCPVWNFDGSSTGQAHEGNTDVYLKPVAFYSNPFRGSRDKLVLCETMMFDGTIIPTNTRNSANKVMQRAAEQDPWFGIEQEYSLMDMKTNRPLGWPPGGSPGAQGPFYCGAEPGKVFGRWLVEAHYEACLNAGIKICGGNAEVMPSQWEWQVGPCAGISAGDELWISRYIMYRVAEIFNVGVSFDPKIMTGDWNGAGAHTNVSTKATRAKGSGLKAINEAIEKLSTRQAEHIKAYDPRGGEDNARRLTGRHETASIDKFSWGVAKRNVSIRIPAQVNVDGCGYFEDRRPSSNCDPYANSGISMTVLRRNISIRSSFSLTLLRRRNSSDMSAARTTRSGRAVKNSANNISDALELLGRIRKGEKVAMPTRDESLFDEVDDDQYRKIIDKRRREKFVVRSGGDDDVEGYDDDETVDDDFIDDDDDDSDSGKSKKTPVDPTQPSITNFISRGSSSSKKSNNEYSVDEDNVLQQMLSSLTSSKPINRSYISANPAKPQPVKLQQSRKTYGKRVIIDKFDTYCSSPTKRLKAEPSQEPDYEFDDDFTIDECNDDVKAGIHKQLDLKDEMDEQGVNDNITSVPLSDDILQDLKFYTDEEGKQFARFYWYDCSEDSNINPGVVYIYGKTYAESIKQFVSCCAVVRNVKRYTYLLLRDTLDDDGQTSVDADDAIAEFKSVHARKYKITNAQYTGVKKRYAFEREGIPFEANYVEIACSGRLPTVPIDARGRTFSQVLNSTQSCLERFILDMKLRGPCWMRAYAPESSSPQISWARIEVILNEPEQLVVDYGHEVPQAPYLSLISINLRTYSHPETKQNEIIAISCILNRCFYLDQCLTEKNMIDGHFCLLAKPPQKRPFKLPYDFDYARKRYSKTILEVIETERDLILRFLEKFSQVDPDIIVGHDLFDFDYDVLLKRMEYFKIGTWSKLARVKRTQAPQSKYAYKSMFTGRLICDIGKSARELIRCTSYDLTELGSQVLKRERVDYTQAMIVDSFRSSEGVIRLINATMSDNNLILSIMVKLDIMPLALKMANITGSVLFRTLLYGRSERNEYLLLHAFHENNFIVPEKYWSTRKAKGNEPIKGRRKAEYEGGLVLDPKIGYYDTYILLMDFNSLYPSIIQEFNLCFSTVKRPPMARVAEISADQKPPPKAPLPELPGKDVSQGVLPAELSKLVQRRRQVKELMKNPQLKESQRMLYDIEQKALKLTANSMYGCLGFQDSRFYAMHIASLVTAKGRDILGVTKSMVERLGHEVIYGDTDSLMINTQLADYDEVMRRGTTIKAEINRSYRLLEIDIDGVYRPLLLLQKKHYAGLAVSRAPNGEFITKQEVKGIETVRRDRAFIVKEVGEHVLREILASDRDAEQVMGNIHNYLKEIGERVRNNQLPIDSYIISKQLNQNPENYHDPKGMGHVSVALRYNQDPNRERKLKSGDVVPYVICIDGTNNSAIQRAYHRDELEASCELHIDAEWYLIQIHSLMAKLFDRFSSTSPQVLAEMLGIEDSTMLRLPRSTESHIIEQEQITSKSESRYNLCKPLEITCLKCKNIMQIRNFTRLLSKQELETRATTANKREVLSLDSCDKCSYRFTMAHDNLVTQFKLNMRRWTQEFYENWYVCEDPACAWRTRNTYVSIIDGKLICEKCCMSALRREISPAEHNLQLCFLHHLVNVPSDTKDTMTTAVRKEKDKERPYDCEGILKDVYARCKAEIEFALSTSEYNIIDLGPIFQPMTGWLKRQGT